MIQEEMIRSAVEKAAAEQGVEQWEVEISRGEDISAEVRGGEMTGFESHVTSRLSIRVITGGATGGATSDKLDPEVVPALMALAKANAEVKGPSGYSPDFVAPGLEYPAEDGSSHPVPDAATLRKVLFDAGRKLLSSDKRVLPSSSVSGAGASSSLVRMNSKGLALRTSGSSAYLLGEAVAKDGEDTRNDWTITEGDITLLDVSGCVEKAVAQFGAGSVGSGKWNIVFSPDCFNNFLSTFSGTFSGKAAELGLSPYKGMEGRKVASDNVTIIDDPLYPGYASQLSFDGDSMPTMRKEVVANGELKTLLYDLEWAAKAGKETTGNCFVSGGGKFISPYSFHVAPGPVSFESLLKKAGKAIYVTRMKGFHAGANPVSGDFSIESSGFLVEDGEVKGPVEGFTVSGNFREMLKKITAVADDLKFSVTLSPIRCGSPTILVEDLSVAGK